MYEEILHGLLAWGRDIKGFNREHASDAVAVVRGYIDGVAGADGRMIPGLGMKSRDAGFALALEMTVLLWLDDCFDAHLLEPHELDAVGVVLLSGRTFSETAEARGCLVLQSLVAEQAQSEAEYRVWQEYGAAYYRAWQTEALLSDGAIAMSHAEYLENGINSITIPRVLASASALWNLDMPGRLQDPRFLRLVRDLSILSRLQNDLYSVEKERQEGCRANAVLIAERFMPAGCAHAFVTEERCGYERLLREDIDHFGENDPFCRLARILIAAQERFYRDPRQRYHPAASRAPDGADELSAG